MFRNRIGKKALVAVAASTALLMAGCSSGESDEASAAADEVQHLTVAVPFGGGSPSAIPVWLGEELGYFEEEGIEIELVSLEGRPAETVGLVSAGQADIVISSADTLLMPTAQGDDPGLKYLYTAYQQPTQAVAVLEDSEIQRFSDLAEGQVGMPSQGAPYETILRANINGDGGDDSGISSVSVSGAGALESLNRGDITAYSANRGEIELASLATDIDVRYLDYADGLDTLLAAGIMVRADSTDEEMETYTKFLRSYAKSGIFAQENPEAAVRANWEKYPASRTSGMEEDEALEEAVTVLKATVDQFEPTEDGVWGYTAPERWEKQMEYLGIEGDIEDVTELYDNSLIDEVNNFETNEVLELAAQYE